MDMKKTEIKPPFAVPVFCEHCKKSVLAGFLEVTDAEHKIARYKCPDCESRWNYNFNRL